MRIRKQFAGGFAVLCVVSAYLGLAPNTLRTYKQSDKVLHFVTFLLLTLCFYWIFEINRRRNLQLTLLVCTAVLGVGSEVLQEVIPIGRDFDLLDILANILGSLFAVALCTWYHKRMLERKRRAKNYRIVPGDDAEAEDADPSHPSNHDIELGEGVGRTVSGQETGVISAQHRTVEEELDNWDENAEDEWKEGEEVTERPSTRVEAQKTSANGTADGDVSLASKKRDE